jgi:hypothetical protein
VKGSGKANDMATKKSKDDYKQPTNQVYSGKATKVISSKVAIDSKLP